MTNKPRLRNELRARRRGLAAFQQILASKSLMQRAIANISGLKHARNIGFYLAMDGEIDLMPLMQRCLSQGKYCYLPVLDQNNINRLDFARYQTGHRLVSNRFGIAEPAASRTQRCKFNMMDIIFMPTVGFDDDGRRLGMGGGFYDRTLAGHLDSASMSPLLVAVAHDIQYISRLPEEPWDIHPDMTLTPARIITRNK